MRPLYMPVACYRLFVAYGVVHLSIVQRNESLFTSLAGETFWLALRWYVRRMTVTSSYGGDSIGLQD